MAKTKQDIKQNYKQDFKNSFNKIFSRPILFYKRKANLLDTNPIAFALQSITAFGVFGCVVTVLVAVHPNLILHDSTPTGGDMGAHVWWPAYMRDILLPAGRIFGWSMDYYAGFPVGQYYFPVPAVMIAILDIIFPYNCCCIWFCYFAFSCICLGACHKSLPSNTYVDGFCCDDFFVFSRRSKEF